MDVMHVCSRSLCRCIDVMRVFTSTEKIQIHRLSFACKGTPGVGNFMYVVGDCSIQETVVLISFTVEIYRRSDTLMGRAVSIAASCK